MLHSIHVKNMAVIREEEILFSEGLNILTGETGAGKSILLGSVNLALGAKADKNLIRSGSEQALAELEFSVEEPEILDTLKKLDIYPEDGAVTLSRKIMPSKSVSRVNGETVSTAILGETASVLLDIHGQQDSLVLLKSRNQRELLDMFGGKELAAHKASVRELYNVYYEKTKELENSSMDASSRARTMDLLQHEIHEIESASLKEGEDEQLENEYRRLEHGQKIAESVSAVKEYLSGDRCITDLVQAALRELSGVTRYDAELESVYEQLTDAASILQDTEYTVERYLDDFEYDPMRLDEIRERLDLINRLKSKYGNSVENISFYYREQLHELEKLEHYERFLEELEKEREDSLQALLKEAKVLSGLRKEASAAFSEEVIQHMQDLNFASVRFEVHLNSKTEVNADGLEDIEFYVSLNPGESIRPLAQTASGGELSRIMLAIKTVLADRDDIPTLIFDEIDTGISGRTAAKVAEKLKEIAANRQVICITHLPQIAAAADSHFIIEKSVQDGHSETHIRHAKEEETITELARMLGGDVITDTTWHNAKELRELSRRKV